MRILRMSAVALAVLLALALLIARLSRPGRPVPPAPTASPAPTAVPAPTAEPAATPQPQATEPPQATAAPPEALPTAQLPQNFEGAPPTDRVAGREDLIGLYWWMIYSGTDTVHLAELSLSRDEVAEVVDKFSNYFDAYSCSFDPPALRVTFKAGLGALLAIQKGETDALPEADRAVARRAQEAVDALIRPGMTDVEKELAIHDYIAAHCEYQFSEDDADSNSARGFFLNGKCRCAGYVDVFRLLGRLAGLEMEMIGGPTTRDTEGSKGHAWNLIRLDGLWYVVDATWDDMAGDRAYPFFNLPPAVFGSARTWDDSVFPSGARAAALDEKYYYFSDGYLARSAEDELDFAVRQIDDGGSAWILFPEDDYARETAVALARHYGMKGRCDGFSGDMALSLYRFSLK